MKRYGRASAEAFGAQIASTLEYRTGDNLAALCAGLQAITRTALHPGHIVGSLARHDVMDVVENIGIAIAQQWPGRAYAVEVTAPDGLIAEVRSLS